MVSNNSEYSSVAKARSASARGRGVSSTDKKLERSNISFHLCVLCSLDESELGRCAHKDSIRRRRETRFEAAAIGGWKEFRFLFPGNHMSNDVVQRVLRLVTDGCSDSR